jgi:REP element-mobilizing transposase RayT
MDTPQTVRATSRQTRHLEILAERRVALVARALLCMSSMTQPRRVVAGATYLITRRCCQRTFRLRPSPLTTQIVSYCLALACAKTGVVLHAVCFMSNHHHMVVTDANGVLPDFLRELHRTIAKAMNASQGQWENLWSAEPCSVVRLVDDHDIVDKIAYVAANPVAEGLVAKPGEWPSLSLWRQCSVRVRRPRVYFDDRGDAPEALDLRVVAPLGEGSTASGSSWGRRVQLALANKVTEAHRAMRSACRTFLGRAAVLAQSFVKQAQSREPRRTVIPTVAAKDPAARSAMLALQSAFRAAYRRALVAWKLGERAIEFPFGTWWMRVHHHAACALVPPGATA